MIKISLLLSFQESVRGTENGLPLDLMITAGTKTTQTMDAKLFKC
jgi:hypothetical protein